MNNATKRRTLDMAARMQTRFMVQEVLLQAYADMNLDAVIYPTGNIPPQKLGAPNEATLNGAQWKFVVRPGSHARFPVITVQAGFTTHVYDRIRDPKSTPAAARMGAWPRFTEAPEKQEPTVLVGPTPACFPWAWISQDAPSAEPLLISIAGAYQDLHPSPPIHRPTSDRLASK